MQFNYITHFGAHPCNLEVSYIQDALGVQGDVL